MSEPNLIAVAVCGHVPDGWFWAIWEETVYRDAAGKPQLPEIWGVAESIVAAIAKIEEFGGSGCKLYRAHWRVREAFELLISEGASTPQLTSGRRAATPQARFSRRKPHAASRKIGDPVTGWWERKRAAKRRAATMASQPKRGPPQIPTDPKVLDQIPRNAASTARYFPERRRVPEQQVKMAEIALDESNR